MRMHAMAICCISIQVEIVKIKLKYNIAFHFFSEVSYSCDLLYKYPIHIHNYVVFMQLT